MYASYKTTKSLGIDSYITEGCYVQKNCVWPIRMHQLSLEEETTIIGVIHRDAVLRNKENERIR